MIEISLRARTIEKLRIFLVLFFCQYLLAEVFRFQVVESLEFLSRQLREFDRVFLCFRLSSFLFRVERGQAADVVA